MLLSLLIFLGAVASAYSQAIDVKGVVYDDLGEPLIGATVMVKSTTKGTATDMDGQFHIADVPSGATIEVSYVGMKKVEVKAAPNLEIRMEPVSEVLDGIIVTAFGTAKKSSFTGSATVINSDRIEQKQVSNVMQSLMGEVAGLSMTPSTAPGSTSSMTIRGAGSINAGTEPLIVVDGMPYEGSWNGINPADVENVTVLKDAASSALYGARGANGVILVTTKKGSNGSARVTLDAKWGVNMRGNQIYDRITDPGQYYETHYLALYNGFLNSGYNAAAAHQKANETLTGPSANGGLGYNVYAVPEGEYLIGTNGKLNPHATLGNRIYQNGEYYTLLPDDWIEETYRHGLRQEYNLSVTGGSERAQVYGSFGYLSDEGIIENSNYERFSGKLRASLQVNSWMDFGANFGYTHSVNNYAYSTGDDGQNYATGGVFNNSLNVGAIYPLYVRDGNGNIIYDKNGKVYDWGNGYYNTDGETRPPLINSNSLNSLYVDYYQTNANNMVADGYLNFTLPYGFKINIKGGTNVHERRTKTGYNPYYGWSAQTTGNLYLAHYRTTTFNFQQLLTWVKSYGDNNLNIMIGHENYNYKYSWLSGYKEHAADYENNQELNGFLSFGTSPAGSATTDYNTEGYMARAMWDYADRIFAQASFRRDASSRFHPSHRWGNFWSLGGAWILTRESWLSDIPWLNTLKIKASYGEVGNDNIGYYRYVDSYKINNVAGDMSLSLYAKGNPDISWEKLGNLNAGVEFEFLQSRLNGSFEVYNKSTRDMLLWVTAPNTLAYSGYYKNVGDMKNTGVELNLTGVLVRTKDINWSISMMFNYNQQKVTYLPNENKKLTVGEYSGFQSGNYFIGEGLPLYAFYIPKTAGIDSEGRQLYMATDANGNPTTTTNYSYADLHIIKNFQPMEGSFSTTFSAYGFDFTTQFMFGLGGKGFDQEYAMLMTVPAGGSTGYSFHKDVLNAWTATNTNTDVPRWSYGDQYTGVICDRYLISRDYLSLQNIMLGYTLPQKLTKRLFLEKVRIYVNADNIYLWTKRKGYDPRLSSGYGSYSPMRTISGGLNIQF